MTNNCRFHGHKSNWIEEPPNSPHGYRVNCTACGKYVKWGNAAELEEHRADGRVGVVVKYTPPATLEAFLEDDE